MDIAMLNELLRQVAAHIKAGSPPDKRAAALKLDRIAAIATTLSSTIRARH